MNTQPNGGNPVETWEQRREREKAESIATRRALFTGVAAYLPGWNVLETEDEYLGYRFALVNGQGPKVTIDGSNRGMWNVSGYWPMSDTGGYMTPSDVRETSPSIGVGKSKTPEQIARDITRRFLPEYLRVYNLLVSKKIERLAYKDRKRVNWETVVNSGLVDSPRGMFNPRKDGYTDPQADPYADVRIKGANGETNYNAGYGELRMTGENSFELKLSSLPVSHVLDVLRAIKGEHRGSR